MAKDAPPNNEFDDEGRIALSALLLDSPGAPRGATPEDGELWDWIHGQVTAARASEIDEHVARDAEVYERWRQLRLHIDEKPQIETASSAATSPSPDDIPSFRERIFSSTRWLGFGRPVLVGAALSALTLSLLLLILPSQTTPPTDFWQDTRYNKNSATRPLEPKTLQNLATVLAGIKTTMADRGIPATDPDGNPLPASTPECLQSNACDPITNDLFAMGKSVAHERLHCLSDSFDFSKRIAPTTQQLITLENEHAAIFKKPVQQWLDAESKASHCDAVAQTIDRALLALQ